MEELASELIQAVGRVQFRGAVGPNGAHMSLLAVMGHCSPPLRLPACLLTAPSPHLGSNSCIDVSPKVSLTSFVTSQRKLLLKSLVWLDEIY